MHVPVIRHANALN